MLCKKCGEDIPAGRLYCPACGTHIETETKRVSDLTEDNEESKNGTSKGKGLLLGKIGKKQIVIATVVFLVLVFVGIAISVFHSYDQKARSGNLDLAEGVGTEEDNEQRKNGVAEEPTEMQSEVKEPQKKILLTKTTKYEKDGTLNGWIEHEYDLQGNETCLKKFGKELGLYLWHENEYDNLGNNTRITYFHEDGVAYNWFEREYDARGNMISQTETIEGGTQKYIKYEYDAANHLLKESSTYSNGSPGYFDVYEYDTLGRLIKMTDYYSEKSLSYIMEYGYDDNNNETLCIMRHADGSLWKKDEMSYDMFGQKIKEWYYDGDILQIYREFTYDANGNMTSVTNYNQDGSKTGWVEYEYDDQGNIIKEKSTNRYGLVEEWTYVNEYIEIP